MIENLKELEKLLKLCRKQGVTEINLNGIAVKLGELPFDSTNVKNLAEEVGDKYQNFPDGELTPEQLMFYSSGGLPEDDPHRAS